MRGLPSGDPSVSWLPEPGDPILPDAEFEPGEIPVTPELGDHKCGVGGHGKPPYAAAAAA